MKSNYLILLIFLLAVNSAVAATGINYQAVARNAAGQPVVNTMVSLKFTVHSDSATGAVAYRETHVVPTSSYGIINVVIGGGMVAFGNLDSLDWSAEKFLQVEYDATGGTNYSDMGTTKMLGSTFSAYAGAASYAANANTSNHAFMADNATHADTAISAVTATTALTANHSLSADNALTANTALTSNHSFTTDNALHADTAISAVTATTALTANHSLSADNALTANTALTATTALTTAGISVYYAESMGQSSTTSSSAVDKLTLTLQPGTYLITFSAMVSSNTVNGAEYNFDSGNDTFAGTPSVTGVDSEFVSVSNTTRVTYNNPTTVRIQYNRHVSGASVRIKKASISALSTN